VSPAPGILRTIRSAGFIGPILVLSGFFDGTAAPKDPKLAGIAAYLFDDDGLVRFRDGWREIGAEFKRDYDYNLGHSFHATSCCGQRGYEIYEGWVPELRGRLCRKLAGLTAATRLAGFAATCEFPDYETFKTVNPGLATRAGSLYAIVLMACIERVGYFARERGEKTFYWFERGDPKQDDANKILKEVQNDPKLCRRYAYFTHAFVPKDCSETVALIAADILAWECQLNFSELLLAERKGTDAGQWTANFKTLRGTDDSRWFHVHLNEKDMAIRGIVNAFHGMA
jgi:hypothetical protein